MSPKTKFTKQDIVDAAFVIAQEKGLSGITARSVAKYLGCSVAPIYVNFETIDDLVMSVVQGIFALSQDLLAKQRGPDIFENIGKASIAFAREYPIFFRELTLKPNPYLASYETIENAMIVAMAGDESMGDWTLDERRRLFFKMRVFQLGLSTMVANDHIPSWLNDQGVEDLLMEVGSDLWKAQNLKREADRR